MNISLRQFKVQFFDNCLYGCGAEIFLKDFVEGKTVVEDGTAEFARVLRYPAVEILRWE